MDTTEFLNNSLVPIRLAAIDKDGFPVICCAQATHPQKLFAY